jgi:predicted GIY-YIG superfamily endonuclease
MASQVFHVYASVSQDEHARVKAHAQKAGLTMSDYVRRCINAWWFEEDETVILLEEKGNGWSRRGKGHP